MTSAIGLAGVACAGSIVDYDVTRRVMTDDVLAPITRTSMHAMTRTETTRAVRRGLRGRVLWSRPRVLRIARLAEAETMSALPPRGAATCVRFRAAT
jgi:hypothetical protein